MGGGIMAPSTIVVSGSIMTKFVVDSEFDKFFRKSQKHFIRMASLRSYDVIFCFTLPYLLKFRNSLFLDQFG